MWEAVRGALGLCSQYGHTTGHLGRVSPTLLRANCLDSKGGGAYPIVLCYRLDYMYLVEVLATSPHVERDQMPTVVRVTPRVGGQNAARGQMI